MMSAILILISVTILLLGHLVDAASTTTSLKPSSADCRKVRFSVHAASRNAVFQYPPNPNKSKEIVAFVRASFDNATGPLTNGTIVVERDFKVNGIYCRPLGPGRGVLQLLLHGGTYNKKMWSGFGIGDDYDWQATATSHGYHTLAIDRLGHGDDRQYLDPIRHVQGGLESEIIHQVIGIIRKGGFRNPLWQRFRRIAYVGHSFGTAVGIALVSKYPTDIDALVAIGFSTSFNGTSLRDLGDLTPAASVSRRFAHLPKGYLTCRSSSNREALLYAGFYDDRIPKFDYRLQDTLTVGEHCYIGFVTPAIGFTKPVLAVVGDNDKIFCDDVTESCVNKLKVTGQRLLPNSDYHIYVPRNTGHTLMLHYTAHQTMHVVHKFLQKHLT